MQRAVKKLKIRGVKTDDDSVQGVVAEIELNDKLKALKDIGEHGHVQKNPRAPLGG